MYIQLDAETGDLELNLPPQLEEYSTAVQAAIMDEFAYEPINKQALNGINAFICQWFKNQGIELPSLPADNKEEGSSKL